MKNFLAPLLFIVLIITSSTYVFASSTNTPFLKIGVFVDKPPFSYINKEGEYDGISIKLWEYIADRLNLDYKFFPITATYDQSVIATSKKHYDVLVGPVSVTHSRIKIIDYSRPYFLNKIGLALSSENESFFSIILGIFGKMLLFMVVTLGLLLIIFSLALWLIEHKKNSLISSRFINGLGDTLWITITSFLRDLIYEPVTTSGRAIISIWLCLSVIFMSAITVVATASLTVSVSKQYSKYTSISDLVGNTFSVEKGSMVVELAKRLNFFVIEERNLLLALKALNKSNQNPGFIGDYYMIDYLIKNNHLSNVSMSPIILMNDEYAFVFPKGSKLVSKVDEEITYMQDNGISEGICKQYITDSHANSCVF